MSKTSLLLITALSSTVFAQQTCSTPTLSQITVKHREKGGVGYNTGYTTAELFLLPPYDLPVYPFIDLRGHVFNDGEFAGNGGLGARYEASSLPIAFGGNVYYDFREKKDDFFSQVSFGVEALSDYLDLRMNGYIPLGKRDITTCPEFCGFSCNSAVMHQEQQTDLALFEAELGTNLPALLAPANFYLALGPYYLFKRETSLGPFGDAWGGRFRLLAEVLDCLTFGLDVTYDSIFQTKVQGLVALTLPFTPSHTNTRSRRWKKLFPAECDTYGQKLARVSRPVYHNEIIPFQKRDTFSALRDPCTGCLYNFVFFYNYLNLPGSGTFVDPYYDLGQALTLTKPGDILYVLPGNPVATYTGVTLQDNQRLVSAAVPLCLGGVEIPALCPGQMPTLTNLGDPGPEGFVNIVTLANNNQVSGFTISGNPILSFGILGNTTSCLISNNSFDDLTVGIDLEAIGDGGFVDISNNTFSDELSASVFIALNQFSSSVLVQNNAFESTTSAFPVVVIENPGSLFEGVVSMNTFVALPQTAISISEALGGRFAINNNLVSGSASIIPLSFTTSASASQRPCLQVLDNKLPNTSSLLGSITLEVPDPVKGINSLKLINLALFNAPDAEFVPLGTCSE